MTETGTPEASPSGEAVATPALSQGERVIDTFIAPSKTFTDILRNQSWWLPFLISVIVTYGYLFAVQKQVGWDTVVENTLKQDPKTVERMASQTAEQQAQARKITLAIIKYSFYASPLFALLFGAVAALILWGTINFVFGGKATFGTVFAVWMYGMLPVVIISILTIITLFAGMDRDSFNLSNPVGTNIGFYLPAEMPQWLLKLATSIDVVWLWGVFLVGIGLAIVAKVKKSAGLAAVFGWWLLLLILKVGYAAITG
jgi:Yip1 domain